MGISDDAYIAGKGVASATSATIAEAVNRALNQFLGDHFRADTGHAVDHSGKRSEDFACVVHTVQENLAPSSFPADTVAALIDCCEDLTIDELRSRYRRVAEAKMLAKTPVPKGETRTNVTLGVILAARAPVPLEAIAEELDCLNAQTPGNCRPDMIVIASTGAINYAVQFPSESITGDFLPPAEGALANYTPAFYVVMVMRPTGDYAFNKMLAFLLGHLGIFAPAAAPGLPDWNLVLDGVTRTAVTVTGYQYNLQGELVPVPRSFYNDRYIAPRPFLIEDPSGEVLATVQYLPWQDGAAILLHGKLPLEGLLIFLGKIGLGGVIRLKHGQISHVLPITPTDFNEWLKRIQRQSNMRVRNDPGRFVIQKLADEGTSSPFMARIFLGVLRLRDAVFSDPTTRENFDKLYDYMSSALMNARTASQKIAHLWEDHARKVAAGEIVRFEGRNIHIAENIDKELRTEVENFLNATTRGLKTGMQNIGNELEVNIGFLFKQKDAFERGVAALEKTDPNLAEYLRQTRTWSEPLMKSRIDLEHGTWVLPRVSYTPEGSAVRTGEPHVADMPVTEFVKFSFDRLCCFVEEFTAHCLQRRMPDGVTIMETSIAQRSAEAPERFRVTVAARGFPAWRIAYHASRFEET